MKKYLLILSCFFLSGCNQSYQDMEPLECDSLSNRHTISVNTGQSGSTQIISAIQDVIGNHSICKRINQEIDEYCILGHLSYQKIQGETIVSKISNPSLIQYLGSGGKRSQRTDSILFSNKDVLGVRTKDKCTIRSKQNSITVNKKGGIEFIKVHRKGLKLYIKYNKSRYIDIIINKKN